MSMTHDEMIAVLEAHRDGRPIEYRPIDESSWTVPYHIGGDPLHPRFDFIRAIYRVKPEPPKPREWWLNVYFMEGDGDANAHVSKEAANMFARPSRKECVHVREVLEIPSVLESNEVR